MSSNTRRGLVRHLAVLVAALLLTAGLGAQATVAPAAPSPEWKTYSYAADGFSASFPSEPSLQKNNVPTAKGSFELRAYLAIDGEAAVFAGVCDYGSAVADRTPDEALDGAQQGAIDNVKAHLVRGRKITLGVYPGREFEAENDTMHFTARVYLVGTTLYQTLIAAPLAKPYAGVPRFLDSFQLIARVKN
ncbi:MAG: hypothetical protein ABSF70_07310 [Terracidiphilus sp.]|jgi:hypothetical protein